MYTLVFPRRLRSVKTPDEGQRSCSLTAWGCELKRVQVLTGVSLHYVTPRPRDASIWNPGYWTIRKQLSRLTYATQSWAAVYVSIHTSAVGNRPVTAPVIKLRDGAKETKTVSVQLLTAPVVAWIVTKFSALWGNRRSAVARALSVCPSSWTKFVWQAQISWNKRTSFTLELSWIWRTSTQ
jgi:hypothetical protein